ncbi:2-dehydropantoate 2-reductase [Malassezia psittaci]|uniref:2-dehydropantoate 2-reductase n=1 Tax=Malassezia psittaci TaxID=1821823 RepID=A0AAF0FEC2_9BASI|nr:2-dehydropantoate 2-reductase [Malassezia psittaci]
MTTSVLVVGAGAIGAFYASRLDAKHAKVAVVCRSNYDMVHRDGFQIESRTFGNYEFRPWKVYSSVEQASETHWDFVIVATKAFNFDKESAQFIADVVSSETSIVLIQNGIDVEVPYRAMFPSNAIISAVSVCSSELQSGRVLKHYRWTRISLGPYSDRYGRSNTDRERSLIERGERASHQLEQLWKDGGISDAETYDALDLQLVRWHKLSINAAMNVSGVLSGCLGNDRMCKDPLLRSHLKACMKEVLDAMPEIYGVPIPEKFASIDAIIASNEKNTNSRSSMVQDWLAHRPIELQAILGNALNITREHNITMPRLESMYALLQSAAKIHMDSN